MKTSHTRRRGRFSSWPSSSVRRAATSSFGDTSSERSPKPARSTAVFARSSGLVRIGDTGSPPCGTIGKRSFAGSRTSSIAGFSCRVSESGAARAGSVNFVSRSITRGRCAAAPAVGGLRDSPAGRRSSRRHADPAEQPWCLSPKNEENLRELYTSGLAAPRISSSPRWHRTMETNWLSCHAIEVA